VSEFFLNKYSKVEPPSPKKTIKSPTQKEAEVVEDDCKQIFVGNVCKQKTKKAACKSY
jgi:hypothetical protein